MQMRWVETSKGSVEVAVAGPTQGEAVLFVHGALVSGSLWSPLVARLSRTHRCFVPTLPLGSHRRAMRPDADLSPAGVADLVAELATALGLPRFVIVANDSGGAVSQLVAVEHGERVRGLFLTNCDALEVFPPPAYAYLKVLGSRPAIGQWLIRALAAVPVLGLAPLAWGSLSPSVTKADVREWVEPAARDAGIRDDFAKFMRGASADVTIAAADALARRPVPMELVWGEADPFFRPTLARRLAAKVPGARASFVPGGRTYVILDAPDAIADAVARFVARLDSASEKDLAVAREIA